TERLPGIVRTFGDPHPQNIDWHAELADLKAGTVANGGTAAIGANHEIGAHVEFAPRRFYTHTCDVFTFDEQVGDLVFHPQVKSRKPLRVTGQKIQKVPLRHENDELAARRQPSEIGDPHGVTVDDSAHLAQFLMRLLEEFIEQAKLIHQFK